MTGSLFTAAEAPAPLPEPPPPEGPGLFGAAPSQEAAPPAPAPYRVLARKYRPNTFAELIGQDALVRTLRNAFAQDRVAHAYLLTGVRGVGKTTTARIIARALNCIGPDGRGGPTVEPCGVCPNCVAILADRHPDVQELDAASNNGVDDVRELKEAVRFRPAQARCKVWILDEVHMLSGPAFNALLKTLEEPPPAVRFIFATTELRKLPATILSRCQTFTLRRVPQSLLRDHFAAIAAREGATLEPEALATIARAADGSVRDGLSLLDQAIAQAGAQGGVQGGVQGDAPGGAAIVTAAAVQDMLGLADRGLVLDVLEAALRGDLPACLHACDRAHARGADPAVLIADLLELTHTLTRLLAVPTLRDDPTLPEQERTRGADLAARLSVPLLSRAWSVLLRGATEVQTAPDRRAAVEMVLIRLAHLADLPAPAELLRRLAEGGEGPPTPAARAGAAPGRPAPATATTPPALALPVPAPPARSAAPLPAAAPIRRPVAADHAHGADQAAERAIGPAELPAPAPPAATAHPATQAAVHALRPAELSSLMGSATNAATQVVARALRRDELPALAPPAPVIATAQAATRAAACHAPSVDLPTPAPPTPAPPALSEWRAIVALAAGHRPRLHAHLLQDVHPVRIAPGRIELRVGPAAPRDLAAQLAALLLDRTGDRWTIALSNAPGAPTLAEQGRAAEDARARAAAAHPLVAAILAAFPGAEIGPVHDAAADAYGLTPTPAPVPPTPVLDTDPDDPFPDDILEDMDP